MYVVEVLSCGCGMLNKSKTEKNYILEAVKFRQQIKSLYAKDKTNNQAILKTLMNKIK